MLKRLWSGSGAEVVGEGFGGNNGAVGIKRMVDEATVVVHPAGNERDNVTITMTREDDGVAIAHFQD